MWLKHDAESMKILGVTIDALTVESLHQIIDDSIEQGKRSLVFYANAHGLNLAARIPSFRDVMNTADHVFCDGHGVMLAARLLGRRLPEKITYADWLPRFAEHCVKKDYSLFLLGSEPGVAKQAAVELSLGYPGLRIEGTHHGFFDKAVGSEANRNVIDTVNKANADVLIVCFGMPLQEEWIARNWNRLTCRVGLTGGAALDYVSGRLKRPPAWMTDHGLEWFGRMIEEPGRLWRRYLCGLPAFFLRVVRQSIAKRNV